MCALETKLPRWLQTRKLRSGVGLAHHSRRTDVLSRSLAQASMHISAGEVESAARMTAALLFGALVPLVPISIVLLAEEYVMYAAFVAVVVPIAAAEAVLSYPAAVASRRALRVTRSSTECVTLMVMCLRHEPSLPKAMAFASRLPSEFAAELRSAIWTVVTGAHSTFDSALNALGQKWSDRDPELKSSIRAMITASCEATEAGKRRALDRANNAIVAGARRKIEEYALSLSVPSMILFGVGIILPLMVGSFLPLLSWDLWTDDSSTMLETEAGASRPTGQVVFLMNAVFPAIALLVAMDALSRHPLASVDKARHESSRSSATAGYALAACFSGVVGVTVSSAMFEGTALHVACLLSLVIPVSTALILYGLRASPSATQRDDDLVEDALFTIGAAMVEGDNFESAFAKAREAPPSGRSAADSALIGLPQAARIDPGSSRHGALAVVREAASKDEAQAGMLAMDLSGYLKEASELQATMRRRLRPTISMMRITAHVLAPVVLGVTHAIYISLASIGGAGGVASGELFLILGVFLAEINAVVAYFVHGIGEARASGELARSAGICILLSTLVYCAVVAVAS